VAPDEPAERRAFEVLDHEVGMRPLENDAEAAQDDGVREARKDLRLTRELLERPRLLDHVRAQQLGYDQGMERLVPGQVDLDSLG
jgi:hypothetical protein